MTRIVAFIVFLMPPWLHAIDPNDGRLYKEALVKAIKSSDRIVVTEHSDRFDYPFSEVNRKDLPQFEYGRIELSDPAKARFLKNVEAMDAATQDLFSSCIFVPHHTVRFYSGSTLKSTMDICFHCGDVQWNGSKHVRPKGLWSAIIPLIHDVGFHEVRDWEALLNERKK
jgi:hypothetical protein